MYFSAFFFLFHSLSFFLSFFFHLKKGKKEVFFKTYF